jgi:hypothetical protein
LDFFANQIIFLIMDNNRRTNYGVEGAHYTSGTTIPTGGVPFYQRISWGAIIAGTLVSLVTMLLLNLLGIGIGLGSINPMEEANPFSGLGVGSIIWWVVSNLIAIFAGAYVAGKLAGVPLAGTSTMHGILSWCLYTLVSFWILTSAVGSIVSGVGSIVSNTLSAAGSGVQAVASNNNQNNSQNSNSGSLISFNEIKQEADRILSSRENVALVPDSIENAAEDMRQDLKSEVNLSTQNIKEVSQAVLFENGQLAENIDRQDVVSALESKTNLSQQEANDVADVMVRKFNEAKQEAEQLKQEAKQQAEQTGQKVAEATSSAAIWTFVALALGAVVSGVGGRTGKPHTVPVEDVETRV